MRKYWSLLLSLPFAFTLGHAATAKGGKANVRDFPMVKHYDKSSPSLSRTTSSTPDKGATRATARDAASGQASGKRTHQPLKSMR